MAAWRVHRLDRVMLPLGVMANIRAKWVLDRGEMMKLKQVLGFWNESLLDLADRTTITQFQKTYRKMSCSPFTLNSLEFLVYDEVFLMTVL